MAEQMDNVKHTPLRPCPFCGAPGVMRTIYQQYFAGCSAGCMAIPAGRPGKDGFRHESNAADIWNTRASDPAYDDIVRALRDMYGLARIKWGNLDSDANKVFEAADRALALAEKGPAPARATDKAGAE